MWTKFLKKIDILFTKLTDLKVRKSFYIAITLTLVMFLYLASFVFFFITKQTTLGFYFLGFFGLILLLDIFSVLAYKKGKFIFIDISCYICLISTIAAFVISYFLVTNKIYLYVYAIIPLLALFIGNLKTLILYGGMLIASIICFFTPLKEYSRSYAANSSYTIFIAMFEIILLLCLGLGLTINFFNETQISRMIKMSNKFKLIAYVDGLTGIYNQNKLIEYISEIEQNKEKQEDEITLFFIDIDNFKGINDTYGHVVGNYVLKEVANVLNEDRHELLVRWGGDEFVVLEKNISEEELVNIANLLKNKVASLTFKDHEDVHITISVGVSTSKIKNRELFNDILNSSDMQLKVAKLSGKNKISIKKI